MLVTSKKRYLPTTINTLVLVKNDDFFYIHRDVYDKAIILTDRYTLEELIKNIEPEHNLSAIQYFYDNTPTPINILAPFLGLVVEGLPEDIEILTGAIHIITAATDVKSYTRVHTELRKTLEFSLYIQEEYEMAWERFFMTSIPYEERNTLNINQPGSLQEEPINNSVEEKILINPLPDLENNDSDLVEVDDEYSKEMEKEKLRNILQIDDLNM
ncbi:hypothetical protein AN1V17_03270 [Vallitalea sediminicola]